jgi:glycosyltransferase involved in cell wall biosynthesis
MASMDPQPPRFTIHQTIAEGDAIGNDITGMYDLFDAMGFAPTLVGEYIRGDFGSRRVTTSLNPTAINSFGLVIYHHSTYWEHGEALLRHYSGAPVLRFHNITPAHYYEGYSTPDAARCRQGLDQTRRLVGLRGDHSWLADSDYNGQHLLALGARPDRIAVVPPFTQVDRLLPQPSVAAYAEGAPLYALFVGRLMPNKGHHTLLRILLAYQRHVARDLHLCIVGWQDAELGSYRAELEGVIERFDLSCRLYDHMSQELLTELFRSCHVYLCMSEHEGFCVPIIEAQAVGLPVVAMDAAAVRGTAGDGQLVGPPPRDDTDHLFYALLLQELFRNADLRRRLVRSGYRNVLARFTRERVEDAFLAAIWPRLRTLR